MASGHDDLTSRRLPTSAGVSSRVQSVWVDGVPVVLHSVESVDGAPGGDVVFFHGWGLGPLSYREPIEGLAAHGFRVTAVALPGFGGSASLPSDCPVQDTVARIAEHVGCAVRESAVADSALLVGHSLGAGVASVLADREPGMARGVVLLSPIGGDTGGLSWVRALASLAGEVQHSSRIRVRDAMPSFLGDFRRTVSTGIAAKSTDLSDVVARVALRVPTTIVVAEDDHVTPTGVLAGLPGVRYRLVPGSHGWLLEDGMLAGSEVLLHERDAARLPESG